MKSAQRSRNIKARSLFRGRHLSAGLCLAFSMVAPLTSRAQSIEEVYSYLAPNPFQTLAEEPQLLPQAAIDDFGSVYYGTVRQSSSGLTSSQSNYFQILRHSSGGLTELLSSSTTINDSTLPAGTRILPPFGPHWAHDANFIFSVSEQGDLLVRAVPLRPGQMITQCSSAQLQSSSANSDCPRERLLLRVSDNSVQTLLTSPSPYLDDGLGEQLRLYGFPIGDEYFGNTGSLILPNAISGGTARVQIGFNQGPIYRSVSGGDIRIDRDSTSINRLTGYGALDSHGERLFAAPLTGWSIDGRFLVATRRDTSLYELVEADGEWISGDGGQSFDPYQFRIVGGEGIPPSLLGQVTNTTTYGGIGYFHDRVPESTRNSRIINTAGRVVRSFAQRNASTGVVIAQGLIVGDHSELSGGIIPGTVFAVEGQPAPGGGRYGQAADGDLIERMSIVDERGGVLFSTALEGDNGSYASSGFGIFYRTPDGQVRAVLSTEMTSIPGLPPGVRITPDPMLASMSQQASRIGMVLNERGAMAFIVTLRSDDPSLNGKQAVFLWSPDTQTLTLVAKAGDAVPGSTQRIRSFSGKVTRSLPSLNGRPVRYLALNDANEVLMIPEVEDEARLEYVTREFNGIRTEGISELVGSDIVLFRDRTSMLKAVRTDSPAFKEALGELNSRHNPQIVAHEALSDLSLNNNGEIVLPIQTFRDYFDPRWSYPFLQPKRGLVKISGLSGSPLCEADTDGSGSITVQDLFRYLDRWFQRDSRADLTGDGVVSVEDTFRFLELYFSQCSSPLLSPPSDEKGGMQEESTAPGTTVSNPHKASLTRAEKSRLKRACHKQRRAKRCMSRQVIKIVRKRTTGRARG